MESRGRARRRRDEGCEDVGDRASVADSEGLPRRVRGAVPVCRRSMRVLLFIPYKCLRAVCTEDSGASRLLCRARYSVPPALDGPSFAAVLRQGDDLAFTEAIARALPAETGLAQPSAQRAGADWHRAVLATVAGQEGHGPGRGLIAQRPRIPPQRPREPRFRQRRREARTADACLVIQRPHLAVPEIPGDPALGAPSGHVHPPRGFTDRGTLRHGDDDRHASVHPRQPSSRQRMTQPPAITSSESFSFQFFHHALSLAQSITCDKTFGYLLRMVLRIWTMGERTKATRLTTDNRKPTCAQAAQDGRKNPNSSSGSIRIHCCCGSPKPSTHKMKAGSSCRPEVSNQLAYCRTAACER